MKSAEQKEHEWKLKRCGKITASVLPDLMTTGRAKDELFGAKALAVMYITRYERRTKTLREQQSNKNFDWGHDNEPLAVEWVRSQLPFSTIKSCTTDFDEIVFNKPFEGFGDSPDFYVYDPSGNITSIGEIKCPIGQAKIEELRFLKEITEKTEYYWQFLGHFVGRPDVDTLYYVIYDGYQNDGRIIEMKRADHEANIQKLTDRIKLVHEVIEVSVKQEQEFKDCIFIARMIVEKKAEIEGLKPKTKGNVPIQNQIKRLKKQIRKLYTNKSV
ncbi:YqaJ viral recombinase family protein [Phocaeicola sp.]